MSRLGRDTPRPLQPPVAQGDVKAEVIHCVGGVLTPQLAKGLEFDLVILINPETSGTGIEGIVDRYVAMTRATQQLVILTSR
jgi:DNA helicase IV